MLIPQVQPVYLIGINTSLLRTCLPTDMDVGQGGLCLDFAMEPSHTP